MSVLSFGFCSEKLHSGVSQISISFFLSFCEKEESKVDGKGASLRMGGF